MKPFTLTARDQALYQILRQHAEQRAVTPKHSELAAMLAEAGHPVSKNAVWEYITRLSRHSLADAIDSAHPSLMTYRVLAGGVWLATMSRAEARERAEIAAMGAAVGDRQGWPVPTKASARAYDRAVMRRDFANHEVRRMAPTETRVHGAIRAGVQAMSYTGCSAALAVA